MLVCWEWLTQYVKLETSVDDLALQFAMSGLNHESTTTVGDDTVLDLEVTSNRGDCLGHIGVAREAAVLTGNELRIPDASIKTSGGSAKDFLSVENRFPEGCPQYTARVIRGVQVGPSPLWLRRRLEAIGVASVNNVVDVTNYVMMECGQPLHAFDLAKIRGGRIIVRRAVDNEQLVAIDHHNYKLDSQMIVIADADYAVALGGVMGGAESEVSEQTTDLVIEAASFNPLPIRRAARQLKLQSPSSFRFERRPDPAGLDWASRRCCELIVEVAGGNVLDDCLVAGDPPAPREPITLRRHQMKRILGIEVPASQTDRILDQLGCVISSTSSESVKIVPPTWRGDLTREVDLIEEVARIYGYDQIPEDVAVPLQVAPVRPTDIAVDRMRSVLSAYGIDEAMTPSVVDGRYEALGSVWTDRPSLETETPLLVGAKLLRRSLLPSLLNARYINQSQAIRNAQLYEIATVFLPGETTDAIPSQMPMLGIVSAGDLRALRGVVEDILAQTMAPDTVVTWSPAEHHLFAPGSLMRISVDGQASHASETIGYVGLLAEVAQKKLSLDSPVACAELSLTVLTKLLQEVRTTQQVSLFPAITRDLNFVVDESLQWNALSTSCRTAGGPLLQEVTYQETYRNPKKDGEGKKRILLSLRYQSLHRTLTSDEVDQSVQAIITGCQAAFSAQLLA